MLFQPHRKRAGTSAPPHDFRTARSVEKGHGRKDLPTITVSSPAFGLQHVAPTGSGVQVGKPENRCTRPHQNGGAVWRDEFACWPGRSQTTLGIDERALGDRKRTALSVVLPRCEKIMHNYVSGMHPRCSRSSTIPSLGCLRDSGQSMLLRPDAHSLIISTTHSLLSWLKVGIRLCNSPDNMGSPS